MPHIQVHTPEGVTLNREIAGSGSRVLAALVDLVLVVLGLVSALLGLDMETTADPSGLSSFILSLVVGGAVLFYVGYFALCHILWNGRTPGKALLELRVTSNDGYPASTAQHLLRALILPIDSIFVCFPVPLPLGLAIVAMSGKRQRLGDLVAGTVVLQERKPDPGREPWMGTTWSELPERTLALDPGMAARLTEEDVEFLRDLVTRRGMAPPDRRKLFVATARHYVQRLGLGAFQDARVVLRELYLFARQSRDRP